MRAAIIDARIAYSEVLHVEIKDSAGELWHLATQVAEWSPSDPAELVGRLVAAATLMRRPAAGARELWRRSAI